MSIYGSVGSLAEMRGHVKDVKPNAGAESIDRFINAAIRDVARRKTWSDLLKFVQIPIPNGYSTGKVTTVTGSTIVTGDGTNNWPTSDLINTTCATAIKQPGIQKVVPAQMRNPANGVTIIPGMWLYVDAGGANPEAVAVMETTVNGFYARFSNTHPASFTIQASTLSARQFRTTYPFYTVIAVPDSNHIWLDMPWSDTGASGLSYMILLAYCQPNPYIWRLQSAWDPIQGVPIDVDNWTFDQVVAGDPQMTASDNPTIMAPAPPTAGGTAQWLIYPPQVSQRYIEAMCDTVWPRLIADEDRCPSFLDPGVFIYKAQSIALRTKTVTEQRPRDPYYDPDQANYFEGQYEKLAEQAEQADEARLAHRLQTYAKTAFGAFSSKYLQVHPGWPTDYNT